jgi:hypothetical protein
MFYATSTAHHVISGVVQLKHNHCLCEVYFLSQLDYISSFCCTVWSELRHPGVVKLMICHSVEV